LVKKEFATRKEAVLAHPPAISEVVRSTDTGKCDPSCDMRSGAAAGDYLSANA